MSLVNYPISKTQPHAHLRQTFLIFWLAAAMSIVQWAGAVTFSTPGLTSIAAAQRGMERITNLETENAAQLPA